MILLFCQSRPLISTVPFPILGLTVGRCNCIAPSAIVLRYFDVALLEVNINNDYSTGVGTSFSSSFSTILNHFPDRYSTRVTRFGVVALVALGLLILVVFFARLLFSS